MNPPYNARSVLNSCQSIGYSPITWLMEEFWKLFNGVMILQIRTREAKGNQVFKKTVHGPVISDTGAGPSAGNLEVRKGCFAFPISSPQSLPSVSVSYCCITNNHKNLNGKEKSPVLVDLSWAHLGRWGGGVLLLLQAMSLTGLWPPPPLAFRLWSVPCGFTLDPVKEAEAIQGKLLLCQC